jgi:hypothetical protein
LLWQHQRPFCSTEPQQFPIFWIFIDNTQEYQEQTFAMSAGRVISSICFVTAPLAGSLFKNKYHVSQIVVDMVFAAFLGSLLWLTSGSAKFFKVDPRSLRRFWIGTTALSLWYLTTIVDLFLHEGRVSAPYSYLFMGVVIFALKFCAEGFLVSTVYRIVVLHWLQQSRVAKIFLILGEALAPVLVLTAMYAVGSLAARLAVWLQLADGGLRSQFARPQNQFEAVFYSVQFCMSVLSVVAAGITAVANLGHEEYALVSHPLSSHRDILAPLSGTYVG